MKNCRDVEPLKAPYVDGEAGPDERSAVDSHITACGRCRDEVAAERAAHDVLVARRDELRVAAPGSLKTRCASLSGALPSVDPASTARRIGIPAAERGDRRKPPVYRRWVPMSLAATLLLAVAGVFALGLTEKVQALAFQMTLDHMACSRLKGGRTSSDADAAAQQWAASAGWRLRVPPSTSETSLELRKVRRCAVLDGRVAHLMYEWHGEPLSVYVLPVDKVGGSAEVERFGHDAVMWSRNGRTYVVLARAPRRAELDDVVRYMKANVY